MISAPPRAFASSAQAWDIMSDDVTLRHSLMTTGFNEQRQRDLDALSHEDRQLGNAGYYLHARVELEIRDTNERAQALYEACREVWEIHGHTRNRTFYRAVFDNCLQPLFGTRLVCVNAELEERDGRMGTPGNSSAAQGSLRKRMDELIAKWNQTLEREARDSDTRARVVRERAARLPTPQVQSVITAQLGKGNGSKTLPDIGQAREDAPDFSWKELEHRFREFQTKVAGHKFTAVFTRTEWESGDVSEEWILGGGPVWRKEFGHLTAIATRKLGHVASIDEDNYWLNYVREQAEDDRNFAWLPFGTVIEHGLVGTTRSFSTEKIAELSAVCCLGLMALTVPQSASSRAATISAPRKAGRKPKRPLAFETIAVFLWNQNRGPNRRVSIAGLEKIASELDLQGLTPPADYLEAKAARELSSRNSKKANSKSGGAIRTWVALVSRGDKDDLRAMRKLLSRCAAKQP